MRVCENGIVRDMTAEEIAAMQEEVEREAAAERKRPLTEQEVSRMLIARQVNSLTVDDETAFRMREFYPSWAAGEAYEAGYKVQRGGRLFRVVQAHTSQTGWEPETAVSLFEEICETHDGSKYDPIPYSGNMELLEGMHYAQDGKTYLCTRGTGAPVYHALRELAGLYVEEVVA